MNTPSIKIRALLLLALLSAFPPLSTDMYLPALPSMAAMWNTTSAIMNLTLVGFFVSFSIALLLYGPLSDRFGRKPVLIAGIGIYVLACVCCGLAVNPTMLIVGRVLQGFGAASASTLSLAMTKDCFDGAERERALAHLAIIVSLAPMLAPVFGGVLLDVASWQFIFFTQALLGIMAIVGVLRMREPKTGAARGMHDVLSSYFRLMCSPRFIGLCSLIALGMTPLFCYIAGSSYVFITQFGVSEQTYSYFFAFNAGALMLGFWICGRLLKKTTGYRIILIGYAGICCSAVLLWLCAGAGRWGMALPMASLTMFLGMTRPPSSHFLLEQVKSDAGSASSIIMFTYFVGGALAMWFISLPWSNKISAIAAVGFCTSALVLLTLPRMRKQA